MYTRAACAAMVGAMASTALSRNAYFRRLGIDVWVPRMPTPPATEQAATEVPREAARPPPRRAQGGVPPDVAKSAAQPTVEMPPKVSVPAPAAAAADVQAFRIGCFRYGRVFVAIGEDAWPRRRFLLGVALALNGFESAEREEIVFEWPQRGVDPNASGRSFRAFFGHQTRAGERALLSGVRVPTLLGHEAPAQTCILNGHLYVAPQAPAGTAKRALWRLIQDMR